MKNDNTSKISNKHKNKLGYIDPTVAGIDIGAHLIHVAFPNGKGEAITQEFKSTTPELRKIANTLKQYGVITAVMESTGVYWIPLFEILEESGLKPILVDAKSVKNVPGRKTDIQDCQWIQTLYSNGLLRAAFRPPRDKIKLRSYVRQRHNIVKTRQFSLLHMEKALQLMNIKLSSALVDISGITGMTIIRAILNGERDPLKLASLRNQRCKKTSEFFIESLTGNFQEEHIFALKQSLDHYEFAGKQLEECDKHIQNELESYPNVIDTLPPRRDKDKNKKRIVAKKPKKNDLSFSARQILWRKSGIDLTSFYGIEEHTALVIFAELGGANVDSWKSAKEFASWLKLCPGNNISGGKRRRSKGQPCSNYITQALRMSAMSAKNSRSAVGAFIRRVSGRTDKSKGIKAGAHKLAHSLYYMCKEGWQYHEKGEQYYEKAYQERSLKNLERKAREYGFELIPMENKN